MADGLLCTEDAAQNVIEKTLVKTCENGDRCGGAGAGVSRGQFPYDNSDRVQLFDKLCVINNNNGVGGGGARSVGGASGSSKQHDSEDGLLDLVEMMMPCSPAEDDCRKKRCVDRYDSSESSDSGVAVLSCTDCSGSSTASSSDLTDPGSPYSTASNHSEDGGGGNSNGGGNTTSAPSPATVTTDPPPPPPRDTSKPSTAYMPPTTDTLTAHHPPWPWSSSTATETSSSPPPTRCLPPTPASSTTVTSSVVHLKRSSSGKSVEDQLLHPVEVASLSDINTATPTITTMPYPKRAKTDTAESQSSTTTTHCLNAVTATLPNLKQDMGGGGGKQFPPPPSRIKSTGNNNNYNGIKSLLLQPSTTTTNELLVMKSTNNNQITAAKLSSAKMQQGKITEYFKSQYKAKELSSVLLKGNTVDKFLSSLVEGSGVASNGAILVGGGIARTKKLIRSLGMPPAGKIQIEKLVKNRKTSTVTTPRKILPAPCKPTSSPTAVRALNNTPTATPTNTATGTPTTILPTGDNQLNLANITNHLNVSGLTSFPPTTTVTLATLAFPPAHSVAYIHKAPGKPPDNNSLFMSQFASLIQQHQQQQQLHNQQQQLHNQQQQQQQHLHTQQQHQLHHSHQQLQQQLHNQHQLHNQQQHHPISNFIKFNVPLVKLNTIATSATTSLPPSGTTAPPHHQQPQQLTGTVTPPSVSMLNTAMPTILTAVKSSTPAIASTISNCQIFTGGDKSQMTASPPPPVAVAASSPLPPANCSPLHPPLADTVAGSTCARIPDIDSTSSPAVPPLTASTNITHLTTTGNTVVDDSSDSGVSSTSSSARERSAQKHHQKTLAKSKPVELVANSQQRFLGGDATVSSCVKQLSPLVVDVSTIATGLATSPVPSLVLKSPILSQPKTIRFPAPVTVINGATVTRQLQRNGRRFRGDGVTTRDVIAGINGIATASLLDTSGDCSVCLWDKCQAQFDASGALLEHLQIKHVISQATQEEYVCLWQGCKVHGRKSCSRSWLERHVLAHAGTKPFRCIVDGCGMRFNSQLTLQRHVNGHFNGDNNTPNGTSKKSVDNNSSLKLYKRNGKKIRFRRQPWSARMFDFIDSSIMEGLQHRLLTMTEKRTMGQFDSSVGDTITLQSEILAKRVEADGVKKVLVRYHPGNVICDEWIREADFTATKQASIPVLNSTAKDTLKPHLFPSENGTLNKRQKHRRKPLVIKTT